MDLCNNTKSFFRMAYIKISQSSLRGLLTYSGETASSNLCILCERVSFFTMLLAKLSAKRLVFSGPAFKRDNIWSHCSFVPLLKISKAALTRSLIRFCFCSHMFSISSMRLFAYPFVMAVVTSLALNSKASAIKSPPFAMA